VLRRVLTRLHPSAWLISYCGPCIEISCYYNRCFVAGVLYAVLYNFFELRFRQAWWDFTYSCCVDVDSSTAPEKALGELA